MKPIAATSAPKSQPVRPDDGSAFLPDPFAHKWPKRTKPEDPLAEELGKEFVETANSGEDAATEDRDAFVAEELGGPFSFTSAQEEFGDTIDEEPDPEADTEPFPTAVAPHAPPRTATTPHRSSKR